MPRYGRSEGRSGGPAICRKEELAIGVIIRRGASRKGGDEGPPGRIMRPGGWCHGGDQNMKRRPNCIWRSAVAVLVEKPKFDAPISWPPDCEKVPNPAPGVENVAWFRMLKNSARNCNLNLSVRFVFLMSEKSKFENPGPTKVLRPKFPGLARTRLPVTGLVTVFTPKYASGLAITALEKYCGPPPGARVGVCSRFGLAPKPSKPSNPYCRLPYVVAMVKGKPDWALTIPSIAHPCVRRFGADESQRSMGTSYSKFAAKRCATL